VSRFLLALPRRTNNSSMKPPKALSTIAFAIVAVFGAVADAQTQEAATPETEIVLIKLAQPVYPPLARQAQIVGDVKVRLSIRKDGSVVAADAISGHPMLQEAALASARRSTFECRRCSGPVTVYSLTYTFGLRDDIDCSVKRFHSAKCLYLWSCGNWRGAPPHMPAIAQSQGHITIIVDSPCVETTTVSGSRSQQLSPFKSMPGDFPPPNYSNAASSKIDQVSANKMNRP
jgi:TonB family protein